MKRTFKSILIISTLAFAASLFLNQSIPSTQAKELTSYQAKIQVLNAEIESLQERAKSMPNSWFAQELVAQKFLERARLSGSYNDYFEAESHLDQAKSISGEQGGPIMTIAQLNYSLHRFESVHEQLAQAKKKIILSDKEKASIFGLEADVLFQQGKYAEAFETYQKAATLDRNSTNLFRLGHYHWQLEEFEQAEAFFNEADIASQGLSDQLTAFFELHKGFLDFDQGRYSEALDHYLAADEVFSGWWLIKKNIAEVYILQGQFDKANAIYDNVFEGLRRHTPQY